MATIEGRDHVSAARVHEDNFISIDIDEKSPKSNDEAESSPMPKDENSPTPTTLQQERDQNQDMNETTYLSPRELSLLTTAFSIATFMIAIDGSILATAIPRITSDFHNLSDMGWYGSAYLLTEMAFQPTFGRIYTFFDARTTYHVSIVICTSPLLSSPLIFLLFPASDKFGS